MNPPQPNRNCPLCPRLAAFRNHHRSREPDWYNAPVESFGPLDARLLIVGLAPGLRGANRTGRPFTGDFAGDLLYATLHDFGFTSGRYDSRSDDGLRLIDCRITNAVRCVPPENKPVGAEINACRPFLSGELEAMANLKIILALGGLSHTSLIRTLGLKLSAFKFTHGALHRIEGHPMIADSYHCSRYNTNTGRLTEAMFRSVFEAMTRELS